MSHHGDAFRKKVKVLWHWIVNSGFSPDLPFVLKTAKGRLTDLDCLRTRVQSSSDLVILPSHHPRSERLAEEGIDTYNPGDLSALGSYSIRHGWRAYSVFPSWPALCGPSTVEVSSGLWLCGFEGVSGDGAGDDQDFSHDGGQGDFSGAMIGFDEAIVEVLHRGRMANGGPGGRCARAVFRGRFWPAGSFFRFRAYGGRVRRGLRSVFRSGGRAPAGRRPASRPRRDPTPRTPRRALARRSSSPSLAMWRSIASSMASRLWVSAATTVARLSRTIGSLARSARRPSAWRASTRCLRRAASALRRSSAGNVAGRSTRLAASAG